MTKSMWMTMMMTMLVMMMMMTMMVMTMMTTRMPFLKIKTLHVLGAPPYPLQRAMTFTKL